MWARTEHKMTKCMDNARRPASSADRNGVGVLRSNVCGLGGLSEPVSMQVEFRKKDRVMQRRWILRNSAVTKRRHAGA